MSSSEVPQRFSSRLLIGRMANGGVALRNIKLFEPVSLDVSQEENEKEEVGLNRPPSLFHIALTSFPGSHK